MGLEPCIISQHGKHALSSAALKTAYAYAHVPISRAYCSGLQLVEGPGGHALRGVQGEPLIWVPRAQGHGGRLPVVPLPDLLPGLQPPAGSCQLADFTIHPCSQMTCAAGIAGSCAGPWGYLPVVPLQDLLPGLQPPAAAHPALQGRTAPQGCPPSRLLSGLPGLKLPAADLKFLVDILSFSSHQLMNVVCHALQP